MVQKEKLDLINHKLNIPSTCFVHNYGSNAVKSCAEVLRPPTGSLSYSNNT